MFSGKQLENNNTLSYYGITRDDTIRMTSAISGEGKRVNYSILTYDINQYYLEYDIKLFYIECDIKAFILNVILNLRILKDLRYQRLFLNVILSWI